MKRFFSAAVAVSALVAATQASATDFFPGDVSAPGVTPSHAFLVTGDPFNGPVSAQYGRAGLPGGTFTDRFLFTLGQNGIGTGDITTTFNSVVGLPDLVNPLNLDLLEVTFWNGTTLFNIPITSTGNQETGGGGVGVPITLGQQNILSVTYLSRGFGAYGGTLNFLPTAPIPEPATWAMMLVGFGAIGFAMRRRKVQPKVRFAF